ncbi:MAG: FtsW/RodA/SpoVE family cell cycle protein [Clostridia bacterium]|nr:FtsW/RodA/SpoVE family cell cycle protein [Clostridia bacterium]
MKTVWALIKRAFSNLDLTLFICSLLLSTLSIVTIIGAADNFGYSKLRMQIFIFIIGTILTVVLAAFDFKELVNKLWAPMLIVSVILLLLTLIFGKSGSNMETANKSWLEIPFTGIMIQPSEFVRVTFICTFAKHLFAVEDHINKPLTLLFLAGHACLVVIPILLSGDLGVALIYFAIVLIMLFCAGLHWGYFLALIAVVVLLSPYIWEHLATYQQERIIVGFDPELDPLGKGWQPLLSRKAISAGGLFGKGVFGGSYYEELTASHTDFILATICEKFGFLGGFVVIVTYIVMIIRIFNIARAASKTDFGGLICAGIGGMLVVQILENIGMCFALLPVVGITLPLLSCGGSSMLATFFMLGLLHNVGSHSDGVRKARPSDRFDLDVP